MKRKSRKPAVREEPFVPCGNCVSGWIEMRPYTMRGQCDGRMAAVRCHCWRVHQNKLAEARAQQVTRKHANG